jgi:hypothetical protein
MRRLRDSVCRHVGAQEGHVRAFDKCGFPCLRRFWYCDACRCFTWSYPGDRRRVWRSYRDWRFKP